MKGLLLVLAVGYCLLVSKDVRTGDDWAFIDKFCFASSGSEGYPSLTWVTYPYPDADTPGTRQVCIYDDEGAWARVYGWYFIWFHGPSTANCKEKIDSRNEGGYNAIVNASSFVEYGSAHIEFFREKNPHFWFLATGCCGNPQHFKINYHFQNPGSFWYREFSYENQGLLQTYTVFFLVMLILSALQIGVLIWTVWKHMLHPVIFVFVSSVFLEFASVAVTLVHLYIFAYNGVGIHGLWSLGDSMSDISLTFPHSHFHVVVLDMGSQILFMMLLVLVAKGWLITTQNLTGKIPLAMFLGVFGFAYGILFVIQQFFNDTASTLYFYESIPGIVLCLLRILILGYFIFCVWDTQRIESVKAKKYFYWGYVVVGGLWFIVLPLIVAFAIAIPPYYRKKVVISALLFLHSISFCLMSIVLWPSRKFLKFPQATSNPMMIAGSTPYEAI